MYIFILKKIKKASNKYKIFRKKKKFFSINFIASFSTDTYYFQTDDKNELLKFLFIDCNIIKNNLIKNFIKNNNFNKSIEFLKNYYFNYKSEIFFGNNMYHKIDFNIEHCSKLPEGNKIFIDCF